MEGLDASSLNEEKLSTVHFLPCTIDFDGPLAVNSFFQIQQTKTGLRSSLRGRELIGKELALPAGVVGINAIQDSLKSKTETTWDCTGQFSEITVWQHDIAPDMGQMQDCFQWFDIAQKVRSVYYPLFVDEF